MGGFVGSSGSDYMNYIVGDSVVSGAGQVEQFSEHIISMPGSFLANDHKNTCAFALERSGRERSDYGLDDDSFVFASFNQMYKVTPEIFGVWCDILKAVPNSVLWLLRFPPRAENNLREEAIKRGVDPERLVFSDVVGKEEHIQRAQLADLFLDTPFCGATTGCDVLWSGTPMISRLGEAMHERVGGSLLRACGLEGLCVDTYEEYTSLAVALATDPEVLLSHRLALEEGRTHCDLFDLRKYVYNLEHGLLQIVHGYERGHEFKSIECDFTKPHK